MNLSKRSKIILFILIVGILGALGVYKYAYKPHATIESLEVSFSGNSDDFMTSVQEDAAKWQNKIVQLTGEITSKDAKGIILSTTIYCQFRDSLELSKSPVKKTITIKGRVIGYDDLLEELKLDQCIIQP